MSQRTKRNAQDTRNDLTSVVNTLETITEDASEIKDAVFQTKLKNVRESAYAARDYLNVKLGKNSG
jgi:hypothetical protein